MTIKVFFGTESGNSELVASDIEEQLLANGEDEVEVEDLANVDVHSLATDDMHLIICSTHGEGDLPYTAQPFVQALKDEQPDLNGFKYAMFGLGDSTYENYSRGSEHVDEALRSLGGTRVGPYGRHDASSSEDPSEVGKAWATEALPAFE